jgi:transcriptional regulator with XRE-family HTH domain
VWITVTEPVPEQNQNAFGVAMAQARLREGLTLDDLAERSAVSRRTLIEIEQGRANPSTLKVHAIAHATNTPVGELMLGLCEGHEPPARTRCRK